MHEPIERLDTVIDRYIQRAIEITGSITAAARALGVARSTVQRRLDRMRRKK